MKLHSIGNELMDKFGLLAPPRVVSAAGHFLFWPIACSQYAMSKLGLFQWYSEVYRDGKSRVLLGAVPWPKSTTETLLAKEHVTAVLNVIGEKYILFNVNSRLDVPMPDFAHPRYDDIKQAVEYLDTCVKSGETVYVHCRAGKGRSATVVMCWLVSRMGYTPETAQEYLERKRPQVLSSLKDREVVQKFYNERLVDISDGKS